MKTTKLKIFACGGTGIDISKLIDVPDMPGFTVPEIVNIDTSSANYVGNGEDFYLIPGLNGTGKDPLEGYKAALPVLDDVLKRHKPGVVNIVLASVAGGSGGGIGMALVTELLSRGHAAIIIAIGSISDQTQSRNSMRMIANLDSNAMLKRATRSIPIAYFENQNNPSEDTNGHRGTEAEIDAKVVAFVKRMSMLVSEYNHRLDRMDIHNFIMFDKTNSGSHVPHRLVDVMICRDLAKLKPFVNNTLTVANLLTSRDTPEPDLGSLYSTTGYYQETQVEEATVDGKCVLEDLSFIITPLIRDTRTAWLHETHKRYENVAKDLIASSAKSTDDEDDMEF